MKGFSIQKECPDKIGMTVWYMYVGVKDEDWGSQDVVHFVRCLQSFYDRVPLTDGCSCCAAWLWTLICNISITTENIGFWHVVKVWYISWINWLRESAEVHCAMLLLPKCFLFFWKRQPYVCLADVTLVVGVHICLLNLWFIRMEDCYITVSQIPILQVTIEKYLYCAKTNGSIDSTLFIKFCFIYIDR